MPIILNGYLDFAAGDTQDMFLICPVALQMKEVRLCANAIGADGSNFITLSVQNADASKTYATRATSSSGFSVGVVESLTLGEADDRDFAAGSAIKIRVAATGSGVAGQISVSVLCDLGRDYS